MSQALGRAPLRFAMEPGQAISIGGSVWKYQKRATDRERRLLFGDDDGLVRDFTDREIYQLSLDGKLRFLTLAEKEALERKHPGGRPRVVMDTCSTEDKAHIDLVQHYVRGWQRAGKPSRTVTALPPVIADVAREIGDHAPPSVRSVQRWIELHEETDGDPEAFVRQVANQGNFVPRHDAALYTTFEDWVHKHYLVQPRPTLPWVLGQVKEELKAHNKALPPGSRLKMVGRATIYEMMRSVDRYTATHCHRGREEADHKYRMVEDGPVTERHNECWEIDHTIVDLIVIDQVTGLPIGRPCLTSAIDRHTRMIAGFHVRWDFPGINPTIECLRAAILPKDAIMAKVPGLRHPWPAFNPPGELVSDNAKHFKSKAFKQICRAFGIDPSRTPLKKSWYKGRVERMFPTYMRGLCHMVPGTTFSNVYQRLKEKPPEKVAVCTLAEFEAMLVRFIVDIYHPRVHRGLNTSPLLAYQESMAIHGMKRPLNADEIVSKLAIEQWRTVGREGILFEGLYYRGPELLDVIAGPHLPRKVQIKVNPQDLTKIWFVHPATNEPVPLGIQKSKLKRIRGITLEVHKLAQSMQRLNPALLAGEEGISEAYKLIHQALEARVRGDGLANRALAAKHLDKLRERAEAYANQDPAETDDLPPLEETDISAELMANLAADAAHDTRLPPADTPSAPAADMPASASGANEAPAPAAPEREKRPKPAKAPVPAIPENDDVDFDTLVANNATVKKDNVDE